MNEIKLTEPELLGFLNDAFLFYRNSRKIKSSKLHIAIAHEAIRTLIEQGKPKIMRDEVADIQDEISKYGIGALKGFNELCDWLKLKGIEVSDE